MISNLKEFINYLSDKYKQLFLEVMSSYYCKYQESVKTNGNSNFDISVGLLMSILIEQQKQTDMLTI